MLRLMLLRHAKAVPHRDGADHARALAPRGLSDAEALAVALAGEHLIPDLIAVSDSRRTLETLGAIQAAWPAGGLAGTRVETTGDLYHASSSALLAAIRKLPLSARTVLLIGHNPGIAELALSLAGYGDRYALARMMRKFPTCALAILDFDMETWKEAAIRQGRLDRFVTPADFGGEDTD